MERDVKPQRLAASPSVPAFSYFLNEEGAPVTVASGVMAHYIAYRRAAAATSEQPQSLEAWLGIEPLQSLRKLE